MGVIIKTAWDNSWQEQCQSCIKKEEKLKEEAKMMTELEKDTVEAEAKTRAKGDERIMQDAEDSIHARQAMVMECAK